MTEDDLTELKAAAIPLAALHHVRWPWHTPEALAYGRLASPTAILSLIDEIERLRTKIAPLKELPESLKGSMEAATLVFADYMGNQLINLDRQYRQIVVEKIIIAFLNDAAAHKELSP